MCITIRKVIMLDPLTITMIICTVCVAVTKITIMVCEYCDGKGKAKCVTCKGEGGWEMDDGDFWECDHCKGEAYFDCKECGGTGEIKEEVTVCKNCGKKK
eukprot:261669_1